MAVFDGIRPATRADAQALAELINFAGEGLPLYLWARMAEPGEDPWEVGRRRAQRVEGGFSYRNAFVAETQGSIAGCLIGYALAQQAEPFDVTQTPAMFVPMLELESLAPGTWYVNVLATYPQFRGRGIGGALLDLAETRARDAGLAGMSIIVSDANSGAVRLYERKGYRRMAQRPMVKEQWQNDGENWILLTKDL
jgi:ribosomal protein S18 acetylase RimI-like enzyme